jgi:hypothetical protein
METQTMVKRPLVFFIKKSTVDKILGVRLEGYFEQGIKWVIIWVWTLGLAFGGFTLCPAEGSTYCILFFYF